jgi:hypothetical protein
MKFLDNLFHHKHDSQASFSSFVLKYLWLRRREEYNKSCSILGGEFQPLIGWRTLIINLSLLSLVLMALVLTSYTTANASHHLEKHSCTQLWVYTEPVQKGPCIVFKHLSCHELEKANRANIEFNKGVEAGHLRTLTFNSQLNCPSGNTKEFCSGWKSITQFTLQQYKAGLTDGENYKSSHHDYNTSTDTVKPEPEYKQVSVFCVPVRLPFLVWYQWCVW